MKHLVLFRHAKAERKAESGEDFDRVLTKRGRHDAELMGRVLADTGLRVDAAVVSPAKRTRETWEQAGAAFPGASVAYDRRLYEAAPKTLLQAAEAELKRVGCVIVVAHNPGLQELAIALLKEGGAAGADLARAQAGFPTAAVAAFSVSDDGVMSGARLLYPAEHGGRSKD